MASNYSDTHAYISSNSYWGEAIKPYEKFLNLWQDADPVLHEVANGRNPLTSTWLWSQRSRY